ncbi:MAG: tRNA uridine-5-carboxymethylaminomethyl(34) synthesis GTPase MnmE [Christensenellales bacterium]
MDNKTICAISTPLGNSAINIIRMSGNKSLEIIKKFFSSKNLDYSKIEPRKMYLGNFTNGDISEKCLMVFFKGPNSFTGEDIVELQIHGGEFLAKEILNVLSKECSLASPGEFSKRAFFNGKMSLSEAEGLIDVINAESQEELKSAYSLSTGRFNRQISDFQNDLTNVLAQIEVALDYPEHDEELITVENARNVLRSISEKLGEIIRNSSCGQKIKSGVNVAIVGSPNVGKSSLLNALLGKERAIVSSTAGTTRDTISETILYNGIKFNLTDTAGIRENGDEIENIGIERAKREIEESDVVLFVTDLSRKINKEEKDLLLSLDKNKTIVVQNKADIGNEDETLGYEIVRISALKEENLEELLQKIYEKTIKEKIDTSKIVLTNLRHVNILKEAKQISDETLEKLDVLTLDVVAFEIKRIWETLGKITGQTENEKIIDQIFSKFCLGK